MIYPKSSCHDLEISNENVCPKVIRGNLPVGIGLGLVGVWGGGSVNMLLVTQTKRELFYKWRGTWMDPSFTVCYLRHTNQRVGTLNDRARVGEGIARTHVLPLGSSGWLSKFILFEAVRLCLLAQSGFSAKFTHGAQVISAITILH